MRFTFGSGRRKAGNAYFDAYCGSLAMSSLGDLRNRLSAPSSLNPQWHKGPLFHRAGRHLLSLTGLWEITAREYGASRFARHPSSDVAHTLDVVLEESLCRVTPVYHTHLDQAKNTFSPQSCELYHQGP